MPETGRNHWRKVNAYRGPVSVLLPTRAISVISAEGQPFYDPAADQALFDSIKTTVDPHVKVIELDNQINDLQFADACVEELLALMQPGNL